MIYLTFILNFLYSNFTAEQARKTVYYSVITDSKLLISSPPRDQEVATQQPRLLGLWLRLRQESEAAGGLGRDLPGAGFRRLQNFLAK